MKPFIASLALATLALGACEKSDEYQAVSTFSAAAEATGERSSDPAVLLARCDEQLTRCERDKTGVDFLAAAYIALWLILVGFFFLVRARQRRLVLEMVELRARLARLQSRPPS